jgi:hypothetical protein
MFIEISFAKKCKKNITILQLKNILVVEVNIMPTFLDLRTAQGTRATAVSVTALAPDYVAGIGLQVNSATNIRVDLEATIGVTSAVANNILTISILRYTDPTLITTFASGTVAYTQSFQIPAAGLADAVSLSAADIVASAPAGGILAYAIYVSATGAATYQGLQNLIGTAAAG